MSRKKPCIPISVQNPDDTNENIHQNSAFDKQNTTFPKQNTTFGKQNTTFGKQNTTINNENTCDYCLHAFFNKQSKKRHEKSCKHRNETRLLEIEMDIEMTIPENKTECRFCNKNISRMDALTRHIPNCKERLEYHEQLLKEKNEKQKNEKEKIQNFIQTQNNTINNTVNNTVNNLIIQFHENAVPFGNKRLTDHIKVDKLITLLRNIYKQHQPSQDYEIAGELLLGIEAYLQELPENRNYLIDDKSPIWVVKTESGIKYIDKDKCLNNIVKENAGILCDKRNDIDETNDKVFQNKTITEAFDHEIEFKKQGLQYKPQGQRKLDKIKSGMLLINKNVCDF
jgi:hypothetical protein